MHVLLADAERQSSEPIISFSGIRHVLVERSSIVGPASDGTVRIADNASPRWGPDWQQDDWANRVSAANGLAAYEIHGLRRVLAWVTASLIAVGVVSIGVGVGVKR